MKASILIRENRTQLILEPESPFDEAALKILEKHPCTHRTAFYDCQGGWTRYREGGERDLVIVFDDPPKEKA